MIIDMIYNFIWTIFIKGPLNIISSFDLVINHLSGGIMGDLLFKTNKKFNFSNVPIFFWYFAISGLGLFMIIFAIAMIKILFQNSVKIKKNFILTIENGIKAFLFIFLIPIFFFLVNFAINNIIKVINFNFNNQKNNNIANYLYNIGNTNNNNNIKNDNVPNDYKLPNQINDYNIITQIFGVWFLLFLLIKVGISLIQKLIELFFLFIISPWIMIGMIIDNGKGAFIWKDIVISKFFSYTIILTGYFIFMNFIQTILKINLFGELKGISKSIFIILFICGTGLSIIYFSDIVSNFIGESIDISNSINSIKSTFSSGIIALKSNKIILKTFEFNKNKLNNNYLNKVNFLKYKKFENIKNEENKNNLINKKIIDLNFYLNYKSENLNKFSKLNNFKKINKNNLNKIDFLKYKNFKNKKNNNMRGYYEKYNSKKIKKF